MDLPSREELPDYYAAIAVPISLSEIEVSALAQRGTLLTLQRSRKWLPDFMAPSSSSLTTST